MSGWTLDNEPFDNESDRPIFLEGLAGMRDVSGTFDFKLDGDDPFGGWDPGSVRRICLYAPASLPWYRAWWIRLRGLEWPTDVVAEGEGTVEWDESGVTLTGTFTNLGVWTIRVPPDRSWTGKIERLVARLRR